MIGDLDLVDVQTEEAVLSSMLSGRKVESLTEEHFTSPVRQAMYRLIRSGCSDLVSLERALREGGFEEWQHYPTEVWLVPLLPHKPLVDAVAELKRLALLRPLVAEIDRWRAKAPYLEFDRAVKELGKAIRR